MARRSRALLVSALLTLSAGACAESEDSVPAGATDSGSACTAAPDCAGCETCEEVCTCWGTHAAQCKAQCATVSGGASGSGGANGSGGASGGATAAGGAGGTSGLGGSGASGGTGGETGSCCSVSLSPGCDDPTIAACVCAQDAYCCQYEWDKQCVAEIGLLGCGSCDSGNCSLSLSDPVCSACMQQSCCTPAEACFEDAACVNLAQCITQSCPNASTIAAITSCIDTTCSPYALAKSTMLAYLNCLSSNCSAQCGI